MPIDRQHQTAGHSSPQQDSVPHSTIIANEPAGNVLASTMVLIAPGGIPRAPATSNTAPMPITIALASISVAPSSLCFAPSGVALAP